MAEGPKITRSDDGLYVRYEFDAHYISDEDVKRIRGYIDQLQAENAKLQEELSKWERLTAGIDLPEYPVTQFKPKDLERENVELQDENARLRSCLSDDVENARMIMGENAKLRELVQKMMRFMEDGDWCTTCEVAKECDAQEEYDDDCLMRGVFHARMRELGVEVDDGGDLV